MATIIFNYNGINTRIQCSIVDKMQNIFERFALKTGVNLDNIFFLYGGKRINPNSTFNEIINIQNLYDNEVKILVQEMNKSIINEQIIKSKEIICPECSSSIRLKVLDYKINLFDCKNRHNINNILLKDYEKTQNIDISKIICNKCKIKNKANCFNNEFYKCCSCGMNLCPLCKSIHDKSHKIINYDKKNYICYKHLEYFTKYCNQCNLNLCLQCEIEHRNHNSIYYGDILPNKNEIMNNLNSLKKKWVRLKK